MHFVLASGSPRRRELMEMLGVQHLKILTAKGRSYADLIYVNGVEDSEASRRVEFKFSLKDAEMIEEMNRILSAN